MIEVLAADSYRSLLILIWTSCHLSRRFHFILNKEENPGHVAGALLMRLSLKYCCQMTTDQVPHHFRLYVRVSVLFL